jgi:small subunit ribosomal protein S9
MRNLHFFVKAVARRKKSVANLILTTGTGQIQLNDYSVDEFFVGLPDRILTVHRPFRVIRRPIFDAKVTLGGGGIRGQSFALQLALARSIVLVQPAIRSCLRNGSFLTSDMRKKERRKYSLKKSRKSSQFSKRLR